MSDTALDLIAWLRAQLDEDERAASNEARGWETGSRYEGQPLAWVRHVRRWDVDRVRLEVAAKRAILDDIEERRSVQGFRLAKVLASVYAGQSGYRDEWRPEVTWVSINMTTGKVTEERSTAHTTPEEFAAGG